MKLLSSDRGAEKLAEWDSNLWRILEGEDVQQLPLIQRVSATVVAIIFTSCPDVCCTPPE